MIKTILGLSALVVLGAILLANAAFMLLSPRAWFRLPSWIRANGPLTEEKYASGWGAIQVRLAGATCLGFIGYAVYGSLSGYRLPNTAAQMLPILVWCIVAAVGLYMAINAAFMLGAPRAWFRLPRWLRLQGPWIEEKYASGRASILLRFVGAVMLAILLWVLSALLIRR